MAKQWAIFVDEDKQPHMIIEENGVKRPATMIESERAIAILNEEGSNVIRLWCRNVACAENGKGWIERSRLDASKTVFPCDVCGKGMER